MSYNRFGKLDREVLLPLVISIRNVLLETCTSISCVGSISLYVFINHSILIDRTFKGLTERRKCSMDWFFGLNFHLMINDKGEIFYFMFTHLFVS